MLKRIYISCNSLPNTQKSLSFLYEKIFNSKLKTTEIVLVHESNFNLHDLNIYNLNITYTQGLDNSFEYSALHKMWKDSQNEDFYGLYLHCKGSSKTDEIELTNCLAWVEYMLFGLLDNIDTCLFYLDNGADLVGSMWYRHFKGNFFWGKSTFLRQLLDPLVYYNNIEHYTRYTAEYWISYAYWSGFNNSISLPFPKIKNLFYLPLETDADFLKLKNQHIVPDLNHKYICNSIGELIKNGVLEVYDTVITTKKDFEENKEELFKYVNYDFEIVLC